MTATEKVLYLYFDANDTGEERTATIVVEFSDDSRFEEVLLQLSYDTSIAMERDWAELPVCEERNGYLYRTHYGQLGAKMDARNYTICFDPEVRASLWVAQTTVRVLHASTLRLSPCISESARSLQRALPESTRQTL